jgi:hypothetical protein
MCPAVCKITFVIWGQFPAAVIQTEWPFSHLLKLKCAGKQFGFYQHFGLNKRLFLLTHFPSLRVRPNSLPYCVFYIVSKSVILLSRKDLTFSRLCWHVTSRYVTLRHVTSRHVTSRSLHTNRRFELPYII